MVEGLLAVLSEPGSNPENEFHAWYDTEHLPARLQLAGVRTGRRYQAADAAKPSWLALYELDISVLQDPAYLALRAQRSPREQTILRNLEILDRRIFRRLDATGADRADGPEVMLFSTLTTSDEPGLLAWYRQEHIPLLHQIRGWRRTILGWRIDGGGGTILAVHEIDDAGVFDTPGYAAATHTARRAEVMATVSRRERRSFAKYSGSW